MFNSDQDEIWRKMGEVDFLVYFHNLLINHGKWISPWFRQGDSLTLPLCVCDGNTLPLCDCDGNIKLIDSVGGGRRFFVAV